MTTAVDIITPVGGDALRPRAAGLIHDLGSIAGRALRAVPRDVESIVPAIFIALFFFLVNVATMETAIEAQAPGLSYTAFQMPTAILLGVTGVSRAYALVLDIQNGYFDRLLLTPVRRLAILVGHMIADVTVACVLAIPILALGLLMGVDFEAGILGIPAFIAIAGLWSLAFAGFGYAIALKTGNPAAVQSSFLLFFPFLFLTTSYVPRSQLSPWLDTVASFNPVTYLLEGMRSLVLAGWEWDELGKSVLAVGIVGTASMSMCFAALRGRIRRG
ncbi:MAG: ABC transporter permease [Acidimicrobiales bacterium]